ALAMVLSVTQAARADPCCQGCQHFDCPPWYYHCMEGHPRIKFKKGCPKPICCPCEKPNWGYYQPCWSPWPWPPDWSHCPVTPPAATVLPGSVQTPGPRMPSPSMPD